jgi:hypothetical protein
MPGPSSTLAWGYIQDETELAPAGHVTCHGLRRPSRETSGRAKLRLGLRYDKDETELVPTSRSFLTVHYQPCDTPHLSKKHFLWFWTHADTPIRRYLFATPNDHVSYQSLTGLRRAPSQ